MKQLAATGCLLALLVGTGCYKHSVRDERLRVGERTTEAWKPYVVVGVAPVGKEPLYAECPSGIALFEAEHSFLNLLVGYITWNIFTPMQVTYACAAGERPARRAPTPRSTPSPEAPPDSQPAQEDAHDVPIL